jgi:hypothetical protein
MLRLKVDESAFSNRSNLVQVHDEESDGPDGKFFPRPQDRKIASIYN